MTPVDGSPGAAGRSPHEWPEHLDAVATRLDATVTSLLGLADTVLLDAPDAGVAPAPDVVLDLQRAVAHAVRAVATDVDDVTGALRIVADAASGPRGQPWQGQPWQGQSW